MFSSSAFPGQGARPAFVLWGGKGGKCFSPYPPSLRTRERSEGAHPLSPPWQAAVDGDFKGGMYPPPLIGRLAADPSGAPCATKAGGEPRLSTRRMSGCTRSSSRPAKASSSAGGGDDRARRSWWSGRGGRSRKDKVEWVEWAAHGESAPVEHVSVDHGRFHVLMSKQLLHGTDTCPDRGCWVSYPFSSK